MSTSERKNWYVAQLKPNSLNIAERNLAQQNFTFFCPKRRETRKRRDKLVNVTAPLFPGYIFVQSNAITSHWRSLNATRGISRMVINDPRNPSGLPAGFISELVARCDADGVLAEDHQMKPGEPIRIINGPFSDIITRIEKLEPGQRLQVLIEIMGRETRVSVDQSAVQRLNTVPA